MEIRKAVIPVAGLGTRLLPATKSMPKEMLAVGRKPVVQYVVEEMEACGLKDILFVTGRSKRTIEDHFDFNSELYSNLVGTGKRDLLESLSFENMEATFFYVRQAQPKGLGHAIMQARDFVGNEDFVVALGDSIICEDGKRLLETMLEAKKERNAEAVIAVQAVPWEEVHHYGIVKPLSGQSGAVVDLASIIEKPSKNEAPSNLAVAARYIFSPLIFDMLERTLTDKRGELQVTDAIESLIRQGKRVCVVVMQGKQKRYDIGNYLSYYKAFIDFAMSDPDYGQDLRHYVEKALQGE
ncbi:MAG: UTP--glucose-1-phosphate uridylyltransferase [Deltaproteobacteria bacterium]|nr:UTP--glucose-1-phosphate uridylyltransferase [Deltaproteobacteria bacterium]